MANDDLARALQEYRDSLASRGDPGSVPAAPISGALSPKQQLQKALSDFKSAPAAPAGPGPAEARQMASDRRREELSAMAGSMFFGEIARRAREARGAAAGGGPMAQLIATGVGGAMGAAAGVASSQTMGDIERALGFREDSPPGLSERGIRMFEEAGSDLMISAAVPVAGAVLRGGRNVWRRLLGIGPVQDQAAREARGLGFDLIPTDNRDPNLLSRFYTRVWARLPFFGAAVKKQKQLQGADITQAERNLIWDIAPVEQMAALGTNMNRMAHESFKTFQFSINGMYRQAAQMAEAAGAMIPRRRLIQQASHELRDLTDSLGSEAAGKTKFAEFIEETVLNLPEQLPWSRWRGLGEQISTAMDKAFNAATPSEKIAFTRFKALYKDTLNDLVNPKTGSVNGFLPDGSRDPVLRAFDEADQTFARVTSEIFRTPVGRKFGRIVRPSAAGPIEVAERGRNLDSTFDFIMNNVRNSAEGMGELRKLVGEDTFNSAISTKISSIFSEAYERGQKELIEQGVGGGFNVKYLREQLGLVDKNSSRHAAFEEALKSTGIPMKRLESFVEGLQDATANVPAGTNVFLSRSLQLHGGRAIMKMAQDATTVRQLANVLLVGVIARQGSKLFADTRFFNLAERFVNPALDFSAKKSILNALLTQLDLRPKPVIPDAVLGQPADAGVVNTDAGAAP